MTEPMVTVAVLAVLWLIVVVPMVLQRKDARAGSRSAARFGASMRLLGRRSVIDRIGPAVEQRKPTVHVSGVVNRKPVPAPKESLMRTPERSEMSHARLKMMARRRRALSFLIIGLIVAPIIGLLTTSPLAWAATALFAVGLAGYMLFLRAQARRDRIRREHRQARAPMVTSRDYEATSAPQRFTDRPEAVVDIDEDDIRLDHIDTIDLTGLYTDDEMREDLRRAG